MQGAGQGVYGSIIIDENTGEWVYNLDANDVQRLSENQLFIERFTIEASDSFGGVDAATITVEITGANDTPEIIRGIENFEFTENSGEDENKSQQLTKTGTFAFEDRDLNNVVNISWSLEGENSISWSGGTIDEDIATILADGLFINESSGSASGAVNWTYNVNKVDLNFLNQGEFVSIVYKIEVEDNAGASSDQELSILITGSNDTPTINSSSSTDTGVVIEAGNNDDGTVDDGIASASGQLESNDPDDNATAIWSTDENNANGNYGSFSVTPEGIWTYNINQSTADQLKEGESIIENFSATVTDDAGATADTIVSITVTGTNDSPIISLKESDSDSASLPETEDVLSTSGTLTVTDVDLSETITIATSIETKGSIEGIQLNNDQLAELFTVTYGSINADPSNRNNVVWTFRSNEDAFDYLAKDESLTLTYTVTASDTADATATQDVVITITGTNDAPIIDDAVQTGTITESADNAPGSDSDPDNATGTITFNDVDLADSPTASISASFVTGGTAANSLSEAQSDALLDNLSLGTLIDNPDGSRSIGWSYTVPNSEIDFLGADENVELTFTVEIDDNNGGTDTQNVVITITGTNDAPIIDDAVQTGTITESADNAPGSDTDPDNATGTITFNDVDLADSPTASISASFITGGTAANSLSEAQSDALLDNLSLGTLIDNPDGSGSIGWSYTIPNSELDFLGADETVELTFTVEIDDNNGGTDTQNVVITITGTNDAPIIDDAVQTGTITESADNAPGSDSDPDNATGTITFNDVDLADSPTASISASFITGGTAANSL